MPAEGKEGTVKQKNARLSWGGRESATRRALFASVQPSSSSPQTCKGKLTGLSRRVKGQKAARKQPVGRLQSTDSVSAPWSPWNATLPLYMRAAQWTPIR